MFSATLDVPSGRPLPVRFHRVDLSMVAMAMIVIVCYAMDVEYIHKINTHQKFYRRIFQWIGDYHLFHTVARMSARLSSYSEIESRCLIPSSSLSRSSVVK